MSQDIESAVTSFVTSYGHAFGRRDGVAILSHFADNVHVASDTGTAVTRDLVADASLRQLIEQLIRGYGERDLGQVQARSIDTVIVSPRLASVKVVWALFNRRDELLYEFTAMYTLDYTTGSCRVVAIAHDEIAQSRQHAP